MTRARARNIAFILFFFPFATQRPVLIIVALNLSRVQTFRLELRVRFATQWSRTIYTWLYIHSHVLFEELIPTLAEMYIQVAWTPAQLLFSVNAFSRVEENQRGRTYVHIIGGLYFPTF